MSCTLMPESRNSLAVPPVETNSMPSRESCRAKSTKPDLSVTLRMARCTRLPTAWDPEFCGAWVSVFALANRVLRKHVLYKRKDNKEFAGIFSWQRAQTG